jgi:hypothetical protein
MGRHFDLSISKLCSIACDCSGLVSGGITASTTNMWIPAKLNAHSEGKPNGIPG